MYGRESEWERVMVWERESECVGESVCGREYVGESVCVRESVCGRECVWERVRACWGESESVLGRE